MDYSTDTLGEIVKQVATLMQAAIEKQKEAQRPLNIREVETRLREVLRQVGAEALEQILSSAAEVPASALRCQCGGK